MLPDLDSNRRSIRRRSYLSTFSVVWAVLCQILCLIFLELEINILRQWRIFYFRSLAHVVLKQEMSLKRIGLHGKFPL